MIATQKSKPQNSTSTDTDTDPFHIRFGYNLPPGLREESRGMKWRTFSSTYSPIGSFRIHSLESTRLRGGKFRYTATISHYDNGQRRTEHKEIIATGPISACTNILADAGHRVEILNFHQYSIFQGTVIFIRVCESNKTTWAMGFGANTELAAASAMTAAAHLLHG